MYRFLSSIALLLVSLATYAQPQLYQTTTDRVKVGSPDHQYVNQVEKDLIRSARTNAVYLGTWNPQTNTPALTSSATSVTAGGYYVASTKGVMPFAGAGFAQGDSIRVGDWLMKLNAQWSLLPFKLNPRSVPEAALADRVVTKRTVSEDFLQFLDQRQAIYTDLTGPAGGAGLNGGQLLPNGLRIPSGQSGQYTYFIKRHRHNAPVGTKLVLVADVISTDSTGGSLITAQANSYNAADQETNNVASNITSERISTYRWKISMEYVVGEHRIVAPFIQVQNGDALTHTVDFSVSFYVATINPATNAISVVVDTLRAEQDRATSNALAFADSLNTAQTQTLQKQALDQHLSIAPTATQVDIVPITGATVDGHTIRIAAGQSGQSSYIMRHLPVEKLTSYQIGVPITFTIMANISDNAALKIRAGLNVVRNGSEQGEFTRTLVASNLYRYQFTYAPQAGDQILRTFLQVNEPLNNAGASFFSVPSTTYDLPAPTGYPTNTFTFAQEKARLERLIEEAKNSQGSGNIPDGSVTNPKLSGGITWEKLYQGGEYQERLIAPDTMYFVQGERLPLYKSSLIGSRDYSDLLKLTVISDAGYNYVYEDFALDPATLGSSFTIALKQKYNPNYLYTKPIVTRVRSTGAVAGKSVVLAGLGDSLLENGFVASISSYLSAYGVNSTVVGTRGNQVSDGRGGWRIENFIGASNKQNAGSTITRLPDGASSSTDLQNPFQKLATSGDKAAYPQFCFRSTGAQNELSYQSDSDKSGNFYIFDFAYYLSSHAITTPGIYFVNLGTNDNFIQRDFSKMEAEYEFIIKRIFDAAPSIKLVLTNPTMATTSSGNDFWRTRGSVWLERMMTKHRSLKATYPNLYLLGAWAHMVSDYNFPTRNPQNLSPINNSQKEERFDIVHYLSKKEIGRAGAALVVNILP